MLGLDADPDAWRALGEREPVVGRLQAAFPGFLTAAFPSPYEAGLGGILAQRTSMRQAAAVRRRRAEEANLSVAVQERRLRTERTSHRQAMVRAARPAP